jgi:S1-C subfamily serine protease
MNYKKITSLFLIIFGLSLNAQCNKSQSQWEEYFKSRINTIDPIEGIWNRKTVWDGIVLKNNEELTISDISSKIAIYRDENGYNSCYISNKKTLDLRLSNTSTSRIYLTHSIYFNEKISSESEGTLSNDSNIFEFNDNFYSYDKYDGKLALFATVRLLKLFPKASDYISSAPSSGTGFAISSNGYILTNYHVAGGMSNIRVRGINENFDKSYLAKVIVEDAHNDLAIIKIIDADFTTLKALPYNISKSKMDTGDDVFVLGYPLRASMGDEIKLTNGIISSRTGFSGDVTSYQISAPIQPGNSGGPLFDENGSVIGIINAKHADTDNVSYAIKVSYLNNLIDLIDDFPKLQTINKLKGEKLSEQVKLIKEFVYVIEVN